MGAIVEVKFFNSFILSKVVDTDNVNATDVKPVWKYSTSAESNAGRNWYIEESRIRGGYNNTSVDYGVKAYIVENSNKASLVGSGLIYSGVYNSRTSFNNTNQFSVGEEITRSLDPSNGSIQKLYAEDTNLVIFQESKVSKALIDKDAIYSAEGGAITTSAAQVIGQVVPYRGNYGISKNPESFAVYANRKYFADKNRNAVLRLSNDGITEISAYGMKDFFREKFAEINDRSIKGKILGGFDVHTKTYVISLQPGRPQLESKTLAFDDQVKGWVSFYSYKPSFLFSLASKFYTTSEASIYLHNFLDTQSEGKRSFYGTDFDSSVKFVFNQNPSVSKVFQTINYEGSDGWKVNSLRSSSDVAENIHSRLEGTYDSATPPNTGAAVFEQNPVAQPVYNAGFSRKDNKYHAIIKNTTGARPGEILFGESMSGIKGYFTTVEIKTDDSTNLNSTKELFAVAANYVESSY